MYSASAHRSTTHADARCCSDTGRPPLALLWCVHSGLAMSRSSRPPGTTCRGSTRSSRSQMCCASGSFLWCVAIAVGQWLMAVRSSLWPRCSHARLSPLLVPPAPQNRSAARMLRRFALNSLSVSLVRCFPRRCGDRLGSWLIAFGLGTVRFRAVRVALPHVQGVWDRARRCSHSGGTLKPVILNRRGLFSLGLASLIARFHAGVTPLRVRL